MAFIDFNLAASVASAAPIAIPASVPGSVTSLTDLERRVVELAREDTLASLLPPRKRSWIERFVFGPTPPARTLANEKLEALRRLAVQAWHKGYTLPASAMRDAHKAGFSDAQVGAVIDIIGRTRAPFRRIAA
ncbi:hypothetical protein [Novosphingobium sp. 9]|uniref:hypothetical protein n=1 Tax=Novosphingobium sp. 9 TaxID=2025349 RepID=UPI0021B5D304|nr:hypothetical protein [Novosphingobium sp. 9]